MSLQQVDYFKQYSYLNGPTPFIYGNKFDHNLLKFDLKKGISTALNFLCTLEINV